MISTNKLRARLIHEGLEETKNIEDRFLLNKHIDRHLASFRFLRSNNLPLTSFMLTKLYRADVVVRQEMSKVLMPIELSIVTKLQYYIEEKGINFYNIMKKTHFENVASLPNSLQKKRKGNNRFVLKTFLGLAMKWQTNDIKFIVFHMTFGQIAALINALPEDASQYTMGVGKVISSISLENIVNVRNFIAHLGQLFTTRDLQITNKLIITLPDLVNHIAATAFSTYAQDLRRSVTSYAGRVIRASYLTTEQKEDLAALFSVIQDRLFGV